MDILSEKYLLLRQVVLLWLTFVALLLLMKYQLPPNRTVHNIINISLAIASVIEFIAIVVISVQFTF